MNRQQALELLEMVQYEGRGARMHMIANGEHVVILTRPKDFHLWSPADFATAIYELERVHPHAHVAVKA